MLDYSKEAVVCVHEELTCLHCNNRYKGRLTNIGLSTAYVYPPCCSCDKQFDVEPDDIWSNQEIIDGVTKDPFRY